MISFDMIVEGVGLLASCVIFISLLSKDMKILRVCNALGSTLFMVYGFMIGSVSIIILNMGSILVNMHHWTRLNKEQKAEEHKSCSERRINSTTPNGIETSSIMSCTDHMMNKFNRMT